MMGMWFLASAYGQYIAGVLGADMSTSGQYKITTVTPPVAGNPLAIKWTDTSEVQVNYKKIDIVFSTPAAEDEKSDWKNADAVNQLKYKLGKKGDTVAVMVAATANDGNESVRLPASLSSQKNMRVEIKPVNQEKLTAYTEGYKQLALYAVVAGVVLIAISPLVKKLMGDVR
jgi:hypothetical protein